MTVEEALRTSMVAALKAFSAVSYDATLDARVSAKEKKPHKPSQVHIVIQKGKHNPIWQSETSARSSWDFTLEIHSSKHREIEKSISTVAQGMLNALRNHNHAAGSFITLLATNAGANLLGVGYKFDITPIDYTTQPGGTKAMSSYNVNIAISHTAILAE